MIRLAFYAIVYVYGLDLIGRALLGGEKEGDQ